MSCILHIETSTSVCSVAVSEDSHVIYHAEEHAGEKGSAAEKLGTMVDEALSFTDNHAIPFDAVAVSCGPGSYTGLRIGVSMAKGICFGRDLKLLAVPTLELLCVPVLLSEKVECPDPSEEGGTSQKEPLLCPMLDARRMEVYAGLYDRALRPVRQVQADVVNGDTYREWLMERPVYFFGNGAEKCMETIRTGLPEECVSNARFIPDVEPLARWMQPLAERRLINGQTEDVAYFEPFYLKDYVAKMPKNPLI